jgi:hypothetical protein
MSSNGVVESLMGFHNSIGTYSDARGESAMRWCERIFADRRQKCRKAMSVLSGAAWRTTTAGCTHCDDDSITL